MNEQQKEKEKKPIISVSKIPSLNRFKENRPENRVKIRLKYKLNDDHIAICITGRLVPIKNHDFFLQVVNEVHKKTTKKLVFFIVGDGELYSDIERKTTTNHFFKLAKEKIIVNNVLVLEIDNFGLLVNKDFYNKDKMNDLDFSKDETRSIISKKSFVYDFLSSMRQKLNDPLGKRKR